MRLIDRVEINYFRSIYSVNLRSLEDLNVVIGGNDSGKSNLLRALNLFFNNETSYAEELNFLQDVTHLRQKEARDTKGRLTIWIKVHFNNVEGWRTLPEKFYIKKTWNRYSQDPEIKSDIESQQAETRFLNKIQYHYVPAIKEKNIFSDYLYSLYETLAEKEDIEFSGPAESLSGAVNSAVSDLTSRIRSNLDIDSEIRVPTNLQSIFERLEFSTEQDNFKVPLINRGDGIQVRHIPHIMDYISRNNRCLNVWAYEEPENSLEMSNSFRLAKEFETEFSEINQLFVTSHSPAFYGLEGKNTKHFVARKERIEGDGGFHMVTTVDNNVDIAAADQELGVAKLIMKRSADAYLEIERLNKINDELKELNRPVVLTEGKTDAILLKAAWSMLYPDKERGFEIRSCDTGGNQENQESAGADQLKKILEATTKSETNPRVGLFDRDRKGIACFDRLIQHTFASDQLEIKINKNQKSAALMLPTVDWGSPFDTYLEGEICIEMLFPYATFSTTELRFEYFNGKAPIKKRSAEKLIAAFNDEPTLIDDISLRVEPKFLKKVKFAERVSEMEIDAFKEFRPLFERIDEAFNILS